MSQNFTGTRQFRNTADMIIMRMCQKNRIKIHNIFTVNLFTQIRAGVDQQVFAFVFEKKGSPQAPVARIGGIGAVPAVEYHWCSISRAGA